jgi:O-antigen/teichoic acid export membrane protein
MSSIFNKILHLTFSRATVVFVNIAVLMVASRYLSLHDYATFRQTFLPYEIMMPIMTLGIPATIYYLLPRRSDKLNLIVQSMLIMSITSLIFSAFLLFGGIEVLAKLFNNPDLIQSMKWLIIYPFLQIPITLLLSVFIYEGKTKFIGIYSSVFALIFALSAIILLVIYKNYMDIVILKALLPALGAIFLLFYTFKLFNASESDKKPFLESSSSILKVSIPFGMASMIGAISLQLDKALVSSFGTTEEFAIYVNGAMEIPLIGVLTGSIAAVLIGEMSKNIKENKLEEALKLFRLSANKTALVLFPMMIFFIYNAKGVMILLYSDKYVLSAWPFMIYLFLLPIRIVVFGSILIAMGKSKIILYRSIIELILNFILSILMFKLFGYLGIAIATVLVTYLWSVPYNIREISKGFSVKRKELFDMVDLGRIMIISLVVSPAILISNFINIYFLQLIVSFIIYATLVLFLFQYFNLVNFKATKISLLKRKDI